MKFSWAMRRADFKYPLGKLVKERRDAMPFRPAMDESARPFDRNRRQSSRWWPRDESR